jgi:hypothetical protein
MLLKRLPGDRNLLRHALGSKVYYHFEQLAMIDQPSQGKLSPRDEELATMLETEFPSIWKAALGVADSHRNIALSMIVRLVRRHIEVAASERERRLTAGKRKDEPE